MKKFDQLWVPSTWQKECSIAQGYNPKKVMVVPEGIDSDELRPIQQINNIVTNPMRFLIIGRWEYRKSTKEMIEAFLKAFPKNENVELVLCVDNEFSDDGMSSTEERLDYFKLNDKRLIVKHFLDRSELLKLMKSTHVFLSCSRSEG